jgi:hypothetical protein
MTEEFKILIDNEEVVSNSNLQIKEEMLSTSSTILKNCYPKVWETTKDYTTNYYFPKDYSKCKIINEKSYPEQPGTRVSGTNLNINYNNTLNWDLEELKGDTSQTGTPTPTSPQAVQTVTGLQKVNVCGKNLFDKSTITSGYYIASNGTLTPDNSNFVGDYISIDNTKSYFASQNAGGVIRVGYYDSNKAFISRQLISANYGSLTIPNNTVYVRLSCYNQSLDTLQLELGTSSTTYEAYTGQSYEVNLGKNLLQFTNQDFSISGVRFYSENGKLYFNGTSTAEINRTNTNYKNNFSFYLEAGTYTIKKNIVGERNKNYFFCAISNYDNNTQYANVNDEVNSVTFTLNEKTKVYLGFYIYQQTFNNETFDLQLEKGQATSHSPYFTPIELCKIGDYQDSIKKSTGKNLFNKDNANVINGYINGTTGVITSDTNARSIYIPCKPNTTYTIQKIVTTRFRVSYSSSLPEIGTETSGIISNYDGTSITITTGNNASYLIAWVCQVDVSTLQDVLDSIQIEEGNQATSYEPYGKVWYIEKKIKKLDMSTIIGWSKNTNGKFYRLSFVNDYGIKIGQLYSNILSYETTAWSGDYKIGITSTSNLWITTGDTTLSDANNVPAWLSNKNAMMYGILTTPTYEVITNEELINQLESIELINGINNISITSADLPGAIQILYNYKEAYTEEDLLFCGCVKNTGNISLNPREPHYVDLQILDFKTLLSEGETLNYVITGKTITEAINQVVASISDYGFVVGNIQILNPDDIINAYSTLNKTAYDVFQYIADITQSRWTTRVIDENTIAIDFYNPTLMPQADPILNTHEYLCNNKIDDISFNYSTNDYRNKQIMTSDEVFANITQTETLIADGYRDSFMCQNKIGVIGKITVNGVEKTFATKSQVELGVTADFVYTPGNMTFDSSITYSAGAVIVITYYPIVKGREIILNSTESTRISNQIGRKGTISRYENRNDTTSSQELIKIGQSYIKYKGSSQITLKIVSENDLFNVGQIVNYDAPIEELDRDYMVKSKTIDMYLNAGKTFYTYELSSSFNSENAINYFDNQRAKSQGNIGEGETITRNIDLESTALIQFYDTDIQEVEVSNQTSLDFGLDGVLI